MLTLGRAALSARLLSRTASLHTAAIARLPEKKPLEKLQQELDSNPFYEKYQEKVKSAMKKKTKIDEETGEAVVEIEPMKEKPLSMAKFAQKKREALASATPTRAHIGPTELPPHVPKLESIIQVDHLGEATSEDITSVWQEAHANDDHALCAAIPAKMYKIMQQRSKKYPLFVFLVPQGEGVEFYLSSFLGHQSAFTPLLEYQTHGPDARPTLSLTNYTELRDSKDIVLMHGEVDKDRLDMIRARLLVNQLQVYYCGDDEQSQSVLRDFHNAPADFDYQRLIDNFNRIFGQGIDFGKAKQN